MVKCDFRYDGEADCGAAFACISMAPSAVLSAHSTQHAASAVERYMTGTTDFLQHPCDTDALSNNFDVESCAFFFIGS